MGAFRDFFEKLFKINLLSPFELLHKKFDELFLIIDRHIFIYDINDADCVSDLDEFWDRLNQVQKSDPSIARAYGDKRKKLAATGANTPADIILGYIGKQVAAGVFAIEKRALPKILTWIDTFATAYKLEKADLDAMKGLAQSGEFGLNAVVGFILGVTVYPAISATTAPAWRKVGQSTEKAVRSNLLAPEILIRAMWRQFLTPEHVNDEMARDGLTDVDIEAYKKTLEFYPAPADFIRFAVRDTFNEAVVTKYQYDLDYPTAIDPYVAKAGMTPEWLKHYWRAHWELPSAMQSFEMLHRGLITQEDIRILLRIADMAPYFIEPLIGISYNPVTRVDLRRLYQSGIYTRDQVLKGYLALGSAPDIAEHLTKWTEQEYAPKEKDLAKEEVLKNYRIGKATSEDVKKLLGVLDYTEDQIAWILIYEDYKLESVAVSEEAETIISEVINGTKTLSDAEEGFNKIKLTQKQKTMYINRAKTEVRKLQYQPPVDTLKAWLKANIITEEVFKVRMSLLKVTSEDIDHYIKEVKGK